MLFQFTHVNKNNPIACVFYMDLVSSLKMTFTESKCVGVWSFSVSVF
jgi:hypothetical protein